jgi:hypothetical protein
LETKFLFDSGIELLLRGGVLNGETSNIDISGLSCLFRDNRVFHPVGVVMRKRLGRLVPIVMIAVLVQLFAPIAMMQAAAAAASDPLAGIVICTGEHQGVAPDTAPAATHTNCCPLCVLAHVAPTLDHPVAPYVAIQRIYQRVAWLENQTPFRHSGIDDRPHARGPPAYS